MLSGSRPVDGLGFHQMPGFEFPQGFRISVGQEMDLGQDEAILADLLSAGRVVQEDI